MSRVAALLVLLLIAGCGKTEPTSPQTEFSSYAEATAYVRANYNAETMRPDSTAIAKAEYYYASGRGYLILSFKRNPSRGYIYRGVPQSLWSEFEDAPSKGRFYNARIKGRYYFRLWR